MKKAFTLTAYGITGIMSAESHGQAKFRLFRELQGLDYKPNLSSIHVRRAPQHDAWAEVDETGACWDPRYLPEPKP